MLIERVGGKAEGLKKLIELGLNVPKAFVITDIGDEMFPIDVDARYRAIGGGKVAVRSSAIGEDSADASFAGQYETVLNVEGPEALRHAIAECVKSIQNDRSDAYRKDQTDQTDVAMSVVVQQMVDARTAGVLFTVDPVSGRRDRMVIDSVNGLGEALVSGHATPDHYILSDKGEVVVREIEGDLPNLNETEIRSLFCRPKRLKHAWVTLSIWSGQSTAMVRSAGYKRDPLPTFQRISMLWMSLSAKTTYSLGAT